MKTINIKLFVIILVVFILIFTIEICLMTPKIHKQFQFNVIEQIIKINSEKGITTENNTTTGIREK